MSATSITVRVPLAVRRRPGRRTVVRPFGEADTIQTRADPVLLKALARAFRWQSLLNEGRYASISELAAAEQIERGYLGKMLQLTLLPPWLVEAIVDGRQGSDVSLPGLMGTALGRDDHAGDRLAGQEVWPTEPFRTLKAAARNHKPDP